MYMYMYVTIYYINIRVWHLLYVYIHVVRAVRLQIIW